MEDRSAGGSVRDGSATGSESAAAGSAADWSAAGGPVTGGSAEDKSVTGNSDSAASASAADVRVANGSAEDSSTNFKNKAATRGSASALVISSSSLERSEPSAYLKESSVGVLKEVSLTSLSERSSTLTAADSSAGVRRTHGRSHEYLQSQLRWPSSLKKLHSAGEGHKPALWPRFSQLKHIITEMTSKITAPTSWELTVMLQQNLVFTKTDKIWDGLDDLQTIMMQAIINTRHKIKLSATIVDDLTKGRKSPDDSPVAKFKTSIINCQEGQRTVNILNCVALRANSNRIHVENFFFHS